MAAFQHLRLLDLPGAQEQYAGIAKQFTPEEVKFPDERRSDESMLRQAKRDRMLSEGFISSRGFVQTWNLTELLLRAYVEPIPWKGGGGQMRSSLGVPILAENFYSSLSAFQQTLFGGNRPFMVEPGATTSMDVAQAQEVLLTAQLKTAGPKGTSAKQQVRALAYEMLLQGTGVAIMGTETRKKKRIVRERRGQNKSVAINGSGQTADIKGNEDDIIERVVIDETTHTTFEHVPIRRLRVAPDWRQPDIRLAAFRGRIFYINSYDMDELRDCIGYNIPTRPQLIALATPEKQDGTRINPMDSNSSGSQPFQQGGVTPTKGQNQALTTSNVSDPLMQDFEVYEEITDTRVVWVLEGQYVIRNDDHNGDIQMVSMNFREAPDSGYGLGMGFWTGDFQRIAQGIVNVFFDEKAIELFGTYKQEGGVQTQSQNAWMFPGKVVGNAKGFEPLQRGPGLGNDPLMIVEQTKRWAASAVGNGASTLGSNPGAPGDMRTKQGVEAMGQGEAVKAMDLIDQACELVFVPLLEFMIEQNRKLKPSQIRAMLTEEMGEKFTADPIDLINASYKVNISAGAKMQAEKALSKTIGYFQTLFQQPSLADQLATQAKKIDYVAFVQAVMQNMGWPYQTQVIVDMTDDDKKRMEAQQNSPSAQLQSKLAIVQAQGEVKKGVDNNQAENRALLKTQEGMMEHMDKRATGEIPNV